jgi:hypothetical protein
MPSPNHNHTTTPLSPRSWTRSHDITEHVDEIGRPETYLNHGVKEQATAAMVAVTRRYRTSARAE